MLRIRFLRMFFAALSGILMYQIAPVRAWADEACSERTLTIQQGLADGRRSAQIWANSWGTLWALATLGQAGAAIATSDRELRKDLWVGAGGSALGLIPTWISPPKIIADAKEEETCPSFDHEQMLLARDVEDEQTNTGIQAHLGNVGVNLAIAAILGPGFGHWAGAGISLGAGIAVGELMIYTYPRSASRLREEIQNGGRASFTITPIPEGAMASVSYAY